MVACRSFDNRRVAKLSGRTCSLSISHRSLELRLCRGTYCREESYEFGVVQSYLNTDYQLALQAHIKEREAQIRDSRKSSAAYVQCKCSVF